MHLRRVVELGPPLLLGLAPLVFFGNAGEFENTPKSAFLQCGIALMALLWLARPGVRVRSRLDLPVVLFYVTCWVSVFGAANPFEAVPLLLHWGAGVLLYFLLVHTLRGPAAVPRFLLAATLSCIAVCLIGIAQQQFGLDWIPQTEAEPASTFGNRNMAAHFVAICFPFALGLTALSANVLQRTVGASSLLLTLVYLLITRTHAAWLALLVVIGAFAIGWPRLRHRGEASRRRSRRTVAVATLLLLASLIGFFLAMDDLDGDRIPQLTGPDGSTAELRLIFWQNTLAMSRDHLFSGVGSGNFKLHYPLYHRAAEIDWTFDEEHQLEHAHNDHLQILAELGLVGLSAWLFLLVTAFQLAWRCVRGSNPWVAQQAFFVALSLAALLIVACFSFPMQRAMPSVYLFALLGMLGFLHTGVAGSSRETPPLSPLLRWAAVPTLVAFLFFSATHARNAVLSDRHYAEGVQRTHAGEHERAIAELDRARRLTPRDANVLLMLASNHTSRGRCDVALELLREVLRIHPNKVNAISSMGYCYLDLEDYAAAERQFLKAIDLLPDSPEAHTNLGTTFFRQEQYALAVSSYLRAVELAETKLFLPGVRSASRRLRPRLLLANVYVLQEDYPRAIAQYEAILDQTACMNDVRTLLAELYRATGEPSRADSLFESSPDCEPL